MKQKGYSLIEIVIGLAIILIFLVATGSLVNAAFTNYRLIMQRNEAMAFAISEMENVLTADTVEVSDVGHTDRNMTSRVKIEKVKNNNLGETNDILNSFLWFEREISDNIINSCAAFWEDDINPRLSLRKV